MDDGYSTRARLRVSTTRRARLDTCERPDLSFVAGLRWPNGVVCPRCGVAEPSFLSTRRLWKCRDCKKQFSAKVGTIFEDSPIGLDRWLPAGWSSTARMASAPLLKRGIKGTYVSVEPFHLFRYLDEQALRFNARKMTDAGRFVAVLRTIVGRRLTYKSLIGDAAVATTPA